MSRLNKPMLGLLIWLPVWFVGRAITWPVRAIKRAIKGERDE